MKIFKDPSTTLFPLPAILVTVGDMKKAEIITVSWTGIVNSEPPMIGISMRPQRSTYQELNENKEFVVNIPNASQVREVDLCGMTSSKLEDKWSLTGFKPQKSQKVSPPSIDDCPINIECRVQQRIELGSHHLFIGQILAVHIEEKYLTPDGKIDIQKLQPFAFTGDAYWKLGENIGNEGFSKDAGLH